MRIGTAHFVNIAAARRYYAQQGFTPADVSAKINAGEIHIGKPAIDPYKQALLIIKDEGRYSVADRCQWFALCDRLATTTVKHSILGDVPCCDRCAQRAKG